MRGPRPCIAVVGLGAMGSGIALAALMHGIDVRLIDSNADTTAASYKRLHQRLTGHIEAGILDPSALTAMNNATVCSTLRDACQLADLVVEAVPESRELKHEVLLALSADTNAVIATNTSALPVDELASSVTHPQRFLGVHFFNPAEWIPGVEVVPGEQTSPESITLALSMLERMSKQPVVVKSTPGFLANRLQLALFAECMRCVDEGIATPEQVDRVVRTTFGFRLPAFGPFAIADMAGLDVYSSILDTLATAYGERFAIPASLRNLLDQRRFGTKTGGGFSDYSEADVERLVHRRDSEYVRIIAATGASAAADIQLAESAESAP